MYIVHDATEFLASDREVVASAGTNVGGVGIPDEGTSMLLLGYLFRSNRGHQLLVSAIATRDQLACRCTLQPPCQTAPYDDVRAAPDEITVVNNESPITSPRRPAKGTRHL